MRDRLDGVDDSVVQLAGGLEIAGQFVLLSVAM